METTQLQALIGTLTVLGMLALVVLPSIIGVMRDRRIDRQLRAAERRAAAVDGSGPGRHPHAGARGAASPAHRTARAA
ncbi:hypothetical protein [Streptomyces adelaidensis]|uniref:hypothetical protein n=1 Tax=Streptomyces adelaidensis TaxID=2796465 RepID=UPI00190351FF|nr:hypothetical protein [Streptomyces adelaidensis]